PPWAGPADADHDAEPLSVAVADDDAERRAPVSLRSACIDLNCLHGDHGTSSIITSRNRPIIIQTFTPIRSRSSASRVQRFSRGVVRCKDSSRGITRSLLADTPRTATARRLMPVL